MSTTLTYARTIGKHDFSAMAGRTVEEYSYYSIGNSGANIINPVEKNWYLSQVTEDFGRPLRLRGPQPPLLLDRPSALQLRPALPRHRYFPCRRLEVPREAWGYFPSFARHGASTRSRSSATSPLTNLNCAWAGEVGNDNIGNDSFVLNMFNNGPTFVDYVFGANQALAPGATVLTWINRGGHWENTEQWSLGVDFGFRNNRLTGSVDGFIRDTNDMLMHVIAPAHVGNRYSATANVGKVRNKGIEITLEHRNNIGKDFSYTVGGNVSFIHNELTALNGGAPIYTNFEGVQVVDQGHSLYYFYGYNDLGVFRTDQEALDYLHGYTAESIPYHAGDTKYADNDGNGIIDGNDRVDLGSSIPWLNYGLNLGAYWKGFDLQLFFQGVGGNKIYNRMRHRLESDGSTSVLSPVMADAWTVDNPDGSIANPRNSINYKVSDRFLESGSYFRLKNLPGGLLAAAQAHLQGRFRELPLLRPGLQSSPPQNTRVTTPRYRAALTRATIRRPAHSSSVSTSYIKAP